MSQSVVQNNLFAIFNVKVTARARMIKIWLSTLSPELLILWQANLFWWYIIVSESILLKKLDYCIQAQSHSEDWKCHSFLSSWYLFNCQILTKLGTVEASLGARVSCKKMGLLASWSRSQQGLLWSKSAILYYILWIIVGALVGWAELGKVGQAHWPAWPPTELIYAARLLLCCWH